MGNRYSSTPTSDGAAELQEREQGETSERLDTNEETRNGSSKLKHPRLIIAVIFFIVSLALHCYTLKNYMDSDIETPNTQKFAQSPDSLIGLNKNPVGCLLTINYTEFRKQVINPAKNCTPRHATDISPDVTPFSLTTYLRIPLECLCTKQFSDTEAYYKDRYLCGNCTTGGSFFIPCQHSGNQTHTDVSNLLLSESRCGHCTCTEDFTGRFCQLPKKLKCIKCDSKACLELPFCNGTSTYPCQDLHDSNIVNCTNKDDDNVQDCLPDSITSTHKLDDKTATTTETYTKNSRAKGSGKYAVSNTTEPIQSTCSRTSAFGYLVIDWIVFVGIIVQFLYVLKKCCCCNDVRNSKTKFKTIYRIIISSGLILIIIPPIVHCVTCCSGTCNTVGKLLPFIKSTFLAITTFLLYKEENVNNN